jgi:CheY-like chemotaxis protein
MAEPSKGEGSVTNLPLPTGTERILLVDDEEAILRVNCLSLERLGYQVTVRLNSREALEAFNAYPDRFDLVITDMAMPGMTGEQLAKALLVIRPSLPIIICTGFSERIDQEKAEAIGAKGFLMKPVVRADLARKVRQVLDESITD